MSHLARLGMGRFDLGQGSAWPAGLLTKRGQAPFPPQAASFALASRFKLTPCSAAIIARLR